MTIRKVGNKIVISTEKQEKTVYRVQIGKNGKPFVALDTVSTDVLHVSDGNKIAKLEGKK